MLGRTLESASRGTGNAVARGLEHDPAQPCRNAADAVAAAIRQPPPKRPASAPSPRCCSAFTMRSNASSAIPNSRRRGSRRSKASPSAICKSCSRTSATTSRHYLRERRLQRCWADLANPSRGASLGVRDRLRLRLFRRRAFQPLVPRPVWIVAARFPATAGRTAVGPRRQGRTARLAAGRDRATASASRRAADRAGRTGADRTDGAAPAKSRRIIICRSTPTMCIGDSSAAR